MTYRERIELSFAFGSGRSRVQGDDGAPATSLAASGRQIPGWLDLLCFQVKWYLLDSEPFRVWLEGLKNRIVPGAPLFVR